MVLGWLLVSAHPQTASFAPGRRFRYFEILKIARYSSGFKIAQALLRTKIYHLWTDTSYWILVISCWMLVTSCNSMEQGAWGKEFCFFV